MLLEKLESIREKMKFETSIIHRNYTQVNYKSTCAKQTIKLLEVYTGDYLHDPRTGKNFK